MVFKPKKSRSLVIQKGKTTGWFKLLVQGEVIPNIQGNPIRCLGKWYDESLSDKNSISSTRKQVEEWLKKIDKYGLPGKNKCWIYQHGLLRDSCGFSLVYEVLLSTVEEMERKFNKHLRRWLGIPPSFTSLGFYIRPGQLQLPLSLVVEEFKVAKCRLALTYRDSRDQLTREAGVRRKSVRKWAASTAINQAQCSLRTKDLIRNPCTGRQGLGTAHFQQWSKSTTREKRTMIQDEVQNLEEEGQNPSSSQLKAPGRGANSPREQSHGVNCGGWSPSVYTFYSKQCLTPYQPQSICTGGGGGRREEGGPTVQVMWWERNNGTYSVRV